MWSKLGKCADLPFPVLPGLCASRVGNVSAASRLREDLKDEDRRLNNELNDLKGLIGAETWRLLRRQGQDAQQEEAAQGLCLPEDVQEQLRALQSVAEVQHAVDKKVR